MWLLSLLFLFPFPTSAAASSASVVSSYAFDASLAPASPCWDSHTQTGTHTHAQAPAHTHTQAQAQALTHRHWQRSLRVIFLEEGHSNNALSAFLFSSLYALSSRLACLFRSFVLLVLSTALTSIIFRQPFVKFALSFFFCFFSAYF